eukprot:scaffold1625_cov104-Isochrysis_galbana.AAC.5
MREQQRQIDLQLDAFFLARLGQRFLIEHYLASTQPPQIPHAARRQRAAFVFALCRMRLWLSTPSRLPPASASLAVPGFSGIIQTNCSPVKVVERAAAEASFLCAARHGVSPHVEVRASILAPALPTPA